MKTRMDESRARLPKAFWTALGVYLQQEATKEDSWRDVTHWNMLKHIDHEIAEIRRSKTQTIRLHNCADLAALSLMLLAKEMDEAKLFDKVELDVDNNLGSS